MLKLNRMMNTKEFGYACSLVFFISGILYVVRNHAVIGISVIDAVRIGLASSLFFVISYLFAVREVAEDSPTVVESVIPVLSVLTPILIVNVSSLFEPDYSFPIVGTTVMILGLMLTLLALFNLGRGFGILPARRMIVSSGLYAFIRHPVYAGEILIGFGLVLTYLNHVGVVILLLGIVTAGLRIGIEEKKLSADEEYREYQSKVKYKLVPIIW
ncbi:MAG: isoprenylcysteine carboxylmethyltransferase family protein [Methanomassiliicoccales archaeon]|nr:MAG: isoprenylcysteine carboxylmethyltransferase family protein [Methanomassiliicoccales archaeon]